MVLEPDQSLEEDDCLEEEVVCSIEIDENGDEVETCGCSTSDQL